MFNNLIIKRGRLFTKMMECKIFNKRKPLVAYLLLTDRCNLRCRYCFVDCSQKKDELTFEEWKNVINQIYKKGCRMICLMGGEPLLYPQIGEIIDHIKKKNIICEMTTNGALLPQKINIIKKLDSIMISLDGDEKANDANRGKGSYQKAIKAIKITREHNIPVRINAVLTKQSKNSIEFLLDLADKYNLYVTFSITADFPFKHINIAKQIVLNDKEIKKIYTQLKKFHKQGRRILFSESTLDYVINYPLPYNKIVLRQDSQYQNYYPHKCVFGKTMFYIDANGDFYPCATLWNSKYYRPMNIRKDGFQKAWNNMEKLPCLTCFCPGVPEWNRIMSLGGLTDGLKITLNQFLNSHRK